MNKMTIKQLGYLAAVGVSVFGAGRASAGQLVPRVPPVWPVAPVAAAVAPFAPGAGAQSRADELYDQARVAIEEGRYERAIDQFDRLIGMKTSRTDAALYWKAYAQNGLGQRSEALTTLAELEKSFGASVWIKEARALEVEIRLASGQPVAPENQSNEELKLLALRGLMESDPDRAVPMIEKLLAGNSSKKVKERALFVLSQSRSTRSREILSSVAKGGSPPDLQLLAIRYIGVMGDTDSRQILDDAYRASSDPAAKRAILRSLMIAGDRSRLLSLAKTETDPSMRNEAVRYLGVMQADAELSELCQTETAVEVRKSILQAMFVGRSDKLIDLARNEKEPELRRTAIRTLGLMRRPGTTEALVSIYESDSNVDVRKAVVNALFLQQNATALVSLARAEKSPEMKKDIVEKLTLMPKVQEARDYLLELLK